MKKLLSTLLLVAMTTTILTSCSKEDLLITTSGDTGFTGTFSGLCVTSPGTEHGLQIENWNTIQFHVCPFDEIETSNGTVYHRNDTTARGVPIGEYEGKMRYSFSPGSVLFKHQQTRVETYSLAEHDALLEKGGLDPYRTGMEPMLVGNGDSVRIERLFEPWGETATDVYANHTRGQGNIGARLPDGVLRCFGWEVL